jgi:hypothetical protein
MTTTKAIYTREEIVAQMVDILNNASDEFVEQAAELVLKYETSRISVSRIKDEYDTNFEVETF